MDLTERAEIRKETFYKLTNSREVPDAPSVGGRNYLRGTSTSYQKYTNTNYILGYPSTYKDWNKLLDPLRDKTVTIKAYIKNDTAYPVRIQMWFTGGGIYGNQIPAHSEGWSIKTGKVSSNWTSANVAFTQAPGETATGGTIQAKEAKVEISDAATPYSQAPEDSGWSTIPPVPTPDQRYLWKFDYIYYSDGSVEVTPPINLSIAGSTITRRETYYKLTTTSDAPGNLVVESKWSKGWLNATGDGSLLGPSGNEERTSDFIRVTAGSVYTFQWWSTIATGQKCWEAWQFYDSNKKPFGGRGGYGEYGSDGAQHGKRTVTAPPNACYIRLSFRSFGNGHMMFEAGAGGANFIPSFGDSLKLGDRNLFIGSRDFSGSWINGGSAVYAEDYQGAKIFKKQNLWGGYSQYFDAKVGEEYVFSAYVKSSAKTDNISFYLNHSSKQPQAGGIVRFENTDGRRDTVSFDLTDKYKRITIKIKITNGGWMMPRLERYNTDAYLFFGGYKFEKGSESTPYSQAPEDYGWTKDPLVPTQSNRYLWKFEYIYYSDGSVEVTDPVNLSIAGQNGATGPQGPKGEQGIAGATGPQGTRGPKGEDGKSTYIHIKYSPVERPNDSQISDTPNTYIGVYTDNIENDSNKASAYTWSKWQGRDGAQGVPGKPGADGKTTYVHFAYANSADGKTNFNTNYFAGALYVGTLTDHTATDSTNYAAYTWSRLKGEDGVIESNGENRIFYGRGDTKKGFFKNATIGTDWNGVPYGEFDDPGWHTTNASDRWIWVSTTDGMKLLGNSGNVPTGKWTMSQDFYITDTMTDTPILGNYLRFHKTDGSFFDPTAIVLDGRDPSLNSRRIPTNAGRRAIWNPEPDRVAYGGNPLINPLEVNVSCNQIKVSTKCVPDELGNGMSQYTVEHIGSQERNLFVASPGSEVKMGTPSAWAPYVTLTGNTSATKDYYLVDIPKTALRKTNSSSELYKVTIPISVDYVTAINTSNPAKAEIHVRAYMSGKDKYDDNVVGGTFNRQQFTLNANGSSGNYKVLNWDFTIPKAVYDTLDDGKNISFFLRLSNVASCKFRIKDADCYYYQPSGGFFIPSVTNAIPKDANRTWTAMLKIRASRNITIQNIGFERFQNLENVTLTPEWQTLYFNGKAAGTYGAFVLYGSQLQSLTSKVIIEIAEVKICNENVSKDTMKNVLLTRYWYRMSQTETLTDTQRVGLNGAISGAVSVWVPKGKKTNAKIRLRNVSLRHGDAEIPFAPAPEDIYDQNNSKVDQDQLDQIANELRDQQDRLTQELAAKALASEVSELTTQIKNLKESDLAGKADITKAVGALEKRLANVIPLGNMSQKLQFIDSYILQGEEGMEIGNKNSGSKVMITPDRIGFFSGGTEVASFSSGQLRINNGFFADTITVGHFMTRKHPNNQYVNGTYFVK